MDLLVFLLFVSSVGLEGLHAHGPSGPVVAQLGGSVLLPCFSESPLPLEGLQVEWRKMDSYSVVSLFQHGASRPDLQSQEFRGRVDFSPDELSKGNFSILLSNVVKDDAGVYRCQVNASNTIISSEAIIEIQDIKHFVVTEVTFFAHEGEDVVLNCSIDSHVPVSEIEEVTWKKTDRDKDILVLLYQDSEIFPDSSHERYQGRVDLFSSEIPKGNFSLKLMNVRMEDNGEFMCEVHTRNISARNIVVLQGIGLSSFDITVLSLCFVALLLAVVLGVLTLAHLRTKVAVQKGIMMMQASLILCPNICIALAFGLWSTECRLSEIVICSAVVIARPVMLMKTAPYLDRFPNCVQRSVMSLAVPLYYSIISVAACSLFLDDIIQAHTPFQHIKTLLALVIVLAVICALILANFDLRIYSTVCLETVNGALLAVFLHQRIKNDVEICSKDVRNNPCYGNIAAPALLPPLIMALMMVLFLQKHYFKGKPLGCLHILLTSFFVTVYCLFEMTLFALIGMTITYFTHLWMFPFEAVMYIIAWLAVIFLSRNYRQDCCSQQRGIGYLCCSVIVLFIIVAFGAICFYFATTVFVNTEDHAGGLALMALVQVLAATSLFKHPKHSPGFLHIMIYMFGSVGLIIINSVALGMELILKAGNRARIIGDLRVIVVPLETVFVSTWLALQIYVACRQLKAGIKHNFEDKTRTGPRVPSEMENLSLQPF